MWSIALVPCVNKDIPTIYVTTNTDKTSPESSTINGVMLNIRLYSEVKKQVVIYLVALIKFKTAPDSVTRNKIVFHSSCNYGVDQIYIRNPAITFTRSIVRILKNRAYFPFAKDSTTEVPLITESLQRYLGK